MPNQPAPPIGQPPSSEDDEDPDGPDEPDGKPEKVRNPKWGLMLEVGIGGGGDDVAKVYLSNGTHQTLSAGDGAAISLGIMVTPLWVGDRLGVGISGTVGYKAWSVGASNGDIGLSRYPLIAAVHLLPRLAPRWLLLLRGGIDKEANVSISGTGVAAGIGADLHATTGGFGEGGFYKIMDTPEPSGRRAQPDALRRSYALLSTPAVAVLHAPPWDQVAVPGPVEPARPEAVNPEAGHPVRALVGTAISGQVRRENRVREASNKRRENHQSQPARARRHLGPLSVGAERVELSTNGLRVRCSTS